MGAPRLFPIWNKIEIAATVLGAPKIVGNTGWTLKINTLWTRFERWEMGLSWLKWHNFVIFRYFATKLCSEFHILLCNSQVKFPTKIARARIADIPTKVIGVTSLCLPSIHKKQSCIRCIQQSREPVLSDVNSCLENSTIGRPLTVTICDLQRFTWSMRCVHTPLGQRERAVFPPRVW